MHDHHREEKFERIFKRVEARERTTTARERKKSLELSGFLNRAALLSTPYVEYRG